MDEKVNITGSKSKGLCITLLILALIITGVSVFVVYNVKKEQVSDKPTVVAKTNKTTD